MREKQSQIIRLTGARALASIISGMELDNRIQAVFAALRMQLRKNGEYYAANEFSDVWYFLISDSNSDEWTLKVGLGEWDGETLFIDASDYRKKMFIINLLTVIGIFIFMPFYFYFSLFWIGAIFVLVMGYLIPRYSILRAKWKIIRRLRVAGVQVRFGGLVHLVQPEFGQVGGTHSVSPRSTP